MSSTPLVFSLFWARGHGDLLLAFLGWPSVSMLHPVRRPRRLGSSELRCALLLSQLPAREYLNTPLLFFQDQRLSYILPSVLSSPSSSHGFSPRRVSFSS